MYGVVPLREEGVRELLDQRSDVLDRLKTLHGVAFDFLMDHLDLFQALPERFRLYTLPLDEPEVLEASLSLAKGGDAEEGPPVWVLMREGRVEAILAPQGPLTLPHEA